MADPRVIKVDVDQRLVDLDNKALPFGGKPISHLKDLLAYALLTADAKKDGKEMHLRYKLAKRIKQGGKIVFDEESLKRIRACVALTCSTIAVGIIYDMLEGSSD